MNAPDSDLQALIEDSAQRIFSENINRAMLEQFEQGELSASLSRLCGEAGFALTPVPERSGGVGGTWRDAWPVLYAAGQWNAPLPIAETMIANSLLSFAGIALPADDAPITIIEADARLQQEGEGAAVRLSGTAMQVPWARHCGHAVVVSRAEQASDPICHPVSVALVDLRQGKGVTITQMNNAANEPRDQLTFDSARCLRAQTAVGLGLARPVLQLGALARAMMISGALQQVLQMTVQYANERIQFGKPIGRNQAIQQQLALLAGEVGAAQMAARVATESWSAVAAAINAGQTVSAETTTQVAFDIAVAKVRAGQAAGAATSIVHQTHGAIGFTYEHMLHFSSRRLWSWRDDFGSASWWAQRLGRAAIAAGKDGFWPALTARSMNPL